MADDPLKFGAEAASALLALAATAKPPSGRCPTAEEIAAWQANALAGDEAARVDAHVPHCQRCLNLWSGLLESSGVLAPTVSQPGGWWSGLTRLWQRPALLATGVIAIALAGLLLQQPFSGAPLVPYELQIDDRMSLRGGAVAASDTAVVYGSGDAFTLTLRPETAVEESVEIRLFADSGFGATPLALPAARIAPSGVLQITGTVGGDVQLPPGASTLYVLVGRAGRLPEVQQAIAALQGQGYIAQRHWAAWMLTMDVETAASP